METITLGDGLGISRQEPKADFEAYPDGFSPNVQDILGNVSSQDAHRPGSTWYGCRSLKDEEHDP